MPTWLVELLEPGMLLSVGFVIFILYLFARLCFKAYPFILKFVNLVHTLVGDDENPGIAVRMNKQSEKLDSIALSQDEHTAKIGVIMHEVLPNHGSSLNDSIRRQEKRLTEHIMDTDKYQPMFQALYEDFNKKEEN